MQAEFKTSIDALRPEAEGVVSVAAMGKFGHVLTGDLLPKYAEQVKRGNVFSGGTAATGVAPGTAIGTTGAFTLANPSGSGVVLVPIVASMGYISGTLGAGVVWYLANTNPSAAAVSGTAITVVKNKLSTASPGNAGLAYTTSTLPAAPTILRPAWSLTALLATTAVQPYLVKDDLDGEFVIAPGCSLTLHSTAAAGTSPLVVFGCSWVEIPE